MKTEGLLNILLIGLVPLVLAGECDPPEILNGEVSGVGDSSSWVGTFRCQAGYILVGAAKAKCRFGEWSSFPPVCSALGVCDRRSLPRVKHARIIKLPEFRGSVYKYRCRRGFTRYGGGNVHCNGQEWDLTNLPICAKSGCDEELVSSIRYGHSKSIDGAIYNFHCDDGAELFGPHTIWCNGQHWNDTAPQCHVEASPPVMTAYTNGQLAEPEQGVLTVRKGDEVTIDCAAEGNPDPEINMLVDHKQVVDTRHVRNSYTFRATPDLLGKVIVCSAQNSIMSGPVTSFLHLRVMYEAEYVSVTGPTSGSASKMTSLSCQTGPSFPQTELDWQIPQGIEVLDRTSEMNQSADGSFITSSSIYINLPEDQESVVIGCLGYSRILGTSIKDEHEIEIYSPTGEPSLVLETIAGELDGSARAGDLLNIHCSANGGAPPAIVTLEMDGEHLASGQQGVSSSLVLGKEHDGATFNCSAINAVMSSPVHVEKTLEVLYGPEKVEIEGPEEVSHGGEMEFFCSTDVTNPPATIHWTVYSDDATVVEPVHQETPSHLRIESGHGVSSGITVVCTARHELGDVEASHRTVILDPVVVETIPSVAVDPVEEATEPSEVIAEEISNNEEATEPSEVIAEEISNNEESTIPSEVFDEEISNEIGIEEATNSVEDYESTGNEIPTDFEEIKDSDESGLNNFEITLGDANEKMKEQARNYLNSGSPYKYEVVENEDMDGRNDLDDGEYSTYEQYEDAFIHSDSGEPLDAISKETETQQEEEEYSSEVYTAVDEVLAEAVETQGSAMAADDSYTDEAHSNSPHEDNHVIDSAQWSSGEYEYENSVEELESEINDKATVQSTVDKLTEDSINEIEEDILPQKSHDQDEYESPSRPMTQPDRHEFALTNEVKPEVTSSKPAVFVAESLKTSGGYAPAFSVGLMIMFAMRMML